MPRGTECAAHRHDGKIPQERHHIWPLGYHGPNVESNLVTICSNAHSDAHYLLEAMLKGKPHNRADYGPGVRAIADAGYAKIMAYAEHLAAEAELEAQLNA